MLCRFVIDLDDSRIARLVPSNGLARSQRGNNCAPKSETMGGNPVRARCIQCAGLGGAVPIRSRISLQANSIR